MTRKILVLGATGLLGNMVFRVLAEGGVDVRGTARSRDAARFFTHELVGRLVSAGNLEDPHQLASVLDTVAPDVVVNCVAVGRPAPKDPMRSIAIYATLPQRLAHLCRLRGTRLVQISSDGVFDGRRGNYRECDVPDADDVYGVAKLLGEVTGAGAVTLRTSIIGPELSGGSGLLQWFLSQQGNCRCYTHAIFSGLTTLELSKVIRDVLLPRSDVQGLYHVASKPISKYELLRLVAERYRKQLTLVPDDTVRIDRSLSAERLERTTGYVPPSWPEMIDGMRDYAFGLARK